MRFRNTLLCLLVGISEQQVYGDPLVITVGVGVCPSYSSMLAPYSTFLPTYSSMSAAIPFYSTPSSTAKISQPSESISVQPGSQQQQSSTVTTLLSSTSTPATAPSSSATTISCGQNYTDASGGTYSIQCDTGLSGTTIASPNGYKERRQDQRSVPDSNGFQNCLNSCDNTPSCQAATYLGATCILYSAVTSAMEVIGGQTGYNQERFVGFVSPDNGTMTSSISDGLVPTVSMSAQTDSASYVSPASILTGYITEGISTASVESTASSISTTSTPSSLTWAYSTPFESSSLASSSAGLGSSSTPATSTSTGVLSSFGVTPPPSSTSVALWTTTTITTTSSTTIPLSSSSNLPMSSPVISSSLSISSALSLFTSSPSASQTSSTSSISFSSTVAVQISSTPSAISIVSSILSSPTGVSSPVLSSSLIRSSSSVATSISSSPSFSASLTVQTTTGTSSSSFSSSSSPSLVAYTSSTSIISTSSSSASNVPSSYPVRNTGKRGLCYTNDSYTLPYALSGQNSQVSWGYNWYIYKYSGNDTIFNPAIQFIPLLYSDAPGLTSVWPAAVENAISQGADALMSFNEPDGCAPGSACMTVNQSVAGYRAYMQPYAGRVKLGAPAITNGGPPSSLTYLGEFMGNCTGCTIDFITLHWYSNVYAFSYLQYYVELAYNQTGLPIWVTEFGIDGSGGTEAQYEAFLEQALPWLDAVPYVERYAYFYDGPGFLINANGTGLSAQGTIYNSYTANCTHWNNSQGHC